MSEGTGVFRLTPGWLHASCVDLEGAGLLVIGASGSGKSELAMALVALGAALVSDDQVELREHGPAVQAHGKPGFEGLIEVRRLGILRAPHQPQTTLKLVVDLDRSEPDRLPPRRRVKIGVNEVDLILGRNIPNLAIASKLWLSTGRVR